jgi:hypothetical protein
MVTIPVPFKQWLPDLPTLGNPGLTEARNVLPGPGDQYLPFRPAVGFTNAVPGAGLVYGNIWARAATGSIENFAGSQTRLARLTSSDTWSDVSKAGNYVGVTSWEFAKFGERIIAVSPQSVPQYYDMGMSSLFADLPGSPPTARHIAVVRDFVFLGNLTNTPDRVQWSGYYNSTIWTTGDRQNMSDFQDNFGDDGQVRKIVGGDRAVIFYENAIAVMNLAPGSPAVFDYRKVSRNRGCAASKSVVRVGDAIFFLSQEGFCVLNGDGVQNIGHGRVNDWFRARAALDSLQDQMVSCVDFKNRNILWSYPTATGGANSETLIYNWASDKWAYANVGYGFLGEYAAPSVSLDGLDAVLGANIDAVDFAVDSPAFQGGQVAPIAFDASRVSGTFTGAPGTALLVGPEVHDPENRFMFSGSLRPLVSKTSPTGLEAYLLHRNVPHAVQTQTPVSGLGPLDEFEFRQRARFVQPVLRITGDFSYAQGMELRVRVGGKR